MPNWCSKKNVNPEDDKKKKGHGTSMDGVGEGSSDSTALGNIPPRGKCAIICKSVIQTCTLW